MKKVFSGIFLVFILIITSSPTYAAAIQIKIDGVAVVSDVNPEIKNNRTMVPLRVISENLGAKVNWSDSQVTLTKNDMQVILKLHSKTVVKNGKTGLLDVKPYIKNNRIFVPMRFLAETFGCNVNYKNSTVTVDTKPLIIDGVKIETLNYVMPMTMGEIEKQMKGHAYIEAIYDIFIKNKGSMIETPDYTARKWMLAEPGDYYLHARYVFFDQKGNSIKDFSIYSVYQGSSESPKDSEYAIYDATENQWYLFNETASNSIYQLLDTASTNGFTTVINNTSP